MSNRTASKYAKYLTLACYNTNVKEFPRDFHPRHGWRNWKDPYRFIATKSLR